MTIKLGRAMCQGEEVPPTLLSSLSMRNVMYPLTQGHRTQLDISKHRKTHKSNAFFVIQKIFKFDSHQYTPL